uniref:MD-2-related lipid-recognition domain-containing protein n=1 Tax=Anopheles atroparvus TaxID=41427 RepID=A0A182J109_ANOAO
MGAHAYGSGNLPANGIARFSVLLICAATLGVAFACNGGYKIRVKKIENCAGPDAVITADENFTVVLTKNCEIKSRGCVRFKDFKTANAKYTISKDGVQVLQGSMDICDQASRPGRTENIAELLQTLGVPDKCPISEGQICTEPSQVVNVNRFKQYLPLARGAIAVDVAVQHDSGKSCFKIRFDITK